LAMPEQRVLQKCWAVRPTDSPRPRLQSNRRCLGREASSFVAWPSLQSCFGGRRQRQGRGRGGRGGGGGGGVGTCEEEEKVLALRLPKELAQLFRGY
jgi:hypothetical protein